MVANELKGHGGEHDPALNRQTVLVPSGLRLATGMPVRWPEARWARRYGLEVTHNCGTYGAVRVAGTPVSTALSLRSMVRMGRVQDRPLGGVVQTRRVVRFARLIHRRIRASGVAFGAILSRPWVATQRDPRGQVAS
jgi:hypothetical protein